MTTNEMLLWGLIIWAVPVVMAWLAFGVYYGVNGSEEEEDSAALSAMQYGFLSFLWPIGVLFLIILLPYFIGLGIRYLRTPRSNYA